MIITAWKVSKYRVFSGPYFPVFGLNTEIYGVNLRIQSKYGKKWTRKNSGLGHFSPRVLLVKDLINIDGGKNMPIKKLYW